MVVVVVVVNAIVVVVVVCSTTTQETSALVDCVSATILVYTPSVNESVICQVIVDPSGTETDNDVSVANEATVKLAPPFIVVYEPLSILYSTFT